MPHFSRPFTRTIALCSMLTLIQIVQPTQAQPSGSAREAPIPAVKLVSPTPTGGPVERNFQGRVVAKDTLELAFEVGGELVELSLTEGSRIARGTPVAALDLAPFERSVRRAELTLAQSERALARASQLAAGNATSQAAAQDAQTARDLAQVTLAEAQEALSNATLVSPFDTLVATRLVAPHTIIEPGVPIARLHDLSQTRVEIDIPERLVNSIPSLADVRFEAAKWQASGAFPAAPDFRDENQSLSLGNSSSAFARLPLELVGFETETGPVGQSYTATLKLPTETGEPALLPGSSITVSASVPAIADGTLLLPASALLSGNDRSASVMVFEPDSDAGGTVRRVPVLVSSRDGASFFVQGIAEGVEVVGVGAHRLQDGDRVRRWSGLFISEEEKL